jgi:hypothetical protein
MYIYIHTSWPAQPGSAYLVQSTSGGISDFRVSNDILRQ